MSDYERRLKAAFAGVHAPESVCSETLAVIERVRDAAGGEGVGSCATETASGKRAHAFRAYRIAAAACLVLLALCAGGASLYLTPTAYADIDVNPSVTLSINRFGRVLGAAATNEDGAAIVREVNLANLMYDKALSVLLSSEAASSYIDEDAYVQITVSSNDAKQAQAMEATGQKQLQQMACQGRCSQVSLDVREDAHAHGMGVGRYQAALELMALDGSITLEDCSHMTMRQLRDEIAARGGSADSVSAVQQHGHGKGEGAGGHGRGKKSGNS